MTGVSPTQELLRAEARAAALEREIARLIEETQRESDALFAQYQLSELLASGGTPAELATAVATELARLTAAAGVACWLREPGRDDLRLAARLGAPFDVPDRADHIDDLGSWADGAASTTLVRLAEDRPVGAIALIAGEGVPLDPEGVRVFQLARHELAVAFRNAQLRQTLEQERRELTAIFEGATDAIVQVDADARVIRINSASLRLLGTTPAAAYGRECGELLGCGRAGGHRDEECPLRAVLATGSAISFRETAAIGAEGERVELVGSYARIPAVDGGARAIAILRDVRDAQALEELRNTFVANVSHELRTPLALIKGYAETLLHLPLDDDERQRYVERIDQLADRLRGLVTGILDVTHLQADPLVLDRSAVTVAALVARVVTELDGAERERIETAIPRELPPVDVDPLRIGQVLDNLVTNALKYAPRPSPVRIDVSQPDPGWVEVRVEDEGVGVPEEDRALVLEPFYRARNVRESTIAGTGLGLAISRRIVEAHGGRLWLADRDDGRAGTTAAFTVPVARRALRRRPTPTPTPTPTSTSSRSPATDAER